MYVVVTDKECVVSRSLKQLNQKMSTQFVDNNFRQLGNNKFIHCSNEDFEFVKDLKIMSSIPMKLLYKKDNMLLYLIIVNMLMTFILMVKGG